MTIAQLQLIEGGIWRDHRGTVRYSNSLPLFEFCRFYTISNSVVGEVRGWHGHKIEAKAIVPLTGKIRVGAVKVFDWEKPIPTAIKSSFDLDADQPQVLLIPGGYANAIVSLSEGATAGVFSSSTLEQSLLDDFRFPSDYWII